MKKLVIITILMMHTIVQGMVESYVCSTQDIILLRNIILDASCQAANNNDFMRAYMLLDKGLKYDRLKKIEKFKDLAQAVINEDQDQEMKLYQELVMYVDGSVSIKIQ